METQLPCVVYVVSVVVSAQAKYGGGPALDAASCCEQCLRNKARAANAKANEARWRLLHSLTHSPKRPHQPVHTSPIVS